jgi:RND family efflux transporter MFP subunit
MANIIKWFIGLLILIAIVGGLGWAVAVRIFEAMEEPQDQREAASVAVEVVEVERGQIRDTRIFTGTLRAQSQVDIAPRISGRLGRLMVDIGDRVERGTVIARLDDEEYMENVEQARADLLVAEASLEERRSAAGIAERDFERVNRLREQRIASESELDTASARYQSEQAAVRVAEAEVTRRRAALRAAEVRQSYATIRADWDTGGPERIVSERFVDEGAMIASNAPIVRLLDIDSVIALVYVTERDYVPLRIGLEASIATQSNAGHHAHGTITRMAPAFQEGSRQARIEIRVPNDEHTLKPGMFVTTTLELAREEDAAIIPRQALLHRDGVEGVFVIDQESMTARFEPVRVGIRERRRVQVLEPMLDGPVVVLGQHLLSDGATVSIAQLDDVQGDVP